MSFFFPKKKKKSKTNQAGLHGLASTVYPVQLSGLFGTLQALAAISRGR